MKSKSTTPRNVIIGIAVLAAAYIIYTQFITFPISQEFVSWEQDGSIVDTAKLNEPVTLNLNIYSNSLIGYSGTTKVQIKKDVPGTDRVVTTKSIPVNIPMGFDKKQSIKLEFTPDENAGGLLDVCKEYFYKVYIGDKAIYDPTTSGDRNGLKVGSQAAGGTVPKVTGILFNDKPQITVSPGTSITTKVKMSGTGTGQLKVEIRKDIALFPDSAYGTLTKDITINDSGIVDMGTWTANEQGIGFREYFARVSWNGNVVYDKTDPEQREYVKVSTSSGDVTTPTTGSVSLKSVQWNVNANQYSTLKSTFRIIGTYDGIVTVDVRKDVFLGTDTNLQSQKHQITGTDTEVTVDTAFTAPNSGDWIFVRVTPNVYDNTDREARKAQGTEIQVTGGSTTPQPTPGTTQPPTQASVFYNIIELTSSSANGLKINVPQGTQVNMYATVSSNTPTSGTLSVEIRRDIIWGDDTSLQTLSKQTNLMSGTNTILVGSFNANELTEGAFRQYFFKTSWNGKVINDPTDPNSRESVTTYTTSTPVVNPTPTPGTTQPPVQGTATLTNIGFTTGSDPQTSITVNKWQNVNVYAIIRATGSVSGSVSVEIRKDYVALPDSSFKILSNSFSISNAGDSWVYIGTFSPDESTGGLLRQFFGRAYLNNALIFDPQDPNTRPRVTVT